MPAIADDICRRYEALKARRSTLDSHCEEVATFCVPRSMGFTGTRTLGSKKMQSLYDSTALHALEMLGAGLHGLATNPASIWFRARLVERGFDDDDSVKDWLSDVTEAMRAEMYAPGSGLTTSLNELYIELGAFGTACQFIGERDDGTVFFQTRPLAECYMAEAETGEVDTVYRKTTMSARQIMQRWPDKAPKDVREAIEAKKPDDDFEIVHAVYPRADREYGKVDNKNKPFASCYVEVKSKTVLEESGFDEFPYAAPRWAKRPNEEYGYAPAMTALPDVKMLQEMMKATIQSAQLAVAPPMQVADDGVVGPVRITPYGLTYVRGQNRLEPLIPGAGRALPVTLEMMEELRNRIRTVFFADVMQFVSDARMTATEVVQRTTERMRLLGPIIGRLESEMLGPMIARVFGILMRNGRLPPPPDAIAGRASIGIEFVSPIAMAQKQVEANAFTQTITTLIPFIQATQNPEILKPFKADKIAPWLWDVFGGDPDLMMTSDEIEQLAQAEAQQAQMAQVMQAAQAGADAANKGAGAVDKMASAQQKGADFSQLVQ